MTTLQLVILLGVGAGLGLSVLIAGCATSRIDLGKLLAHGATSTSRRTTAGWRTLLGGLERFNTRASDLDLDLIGETREKLLLVRLSFAGGGALFLPVLAALLLIAGMPLPVLIPIGLSLAGTVIGWLIPPIMVRSQAQEARRTFRRALSSYFDLVALERQADRGPVEALEHPATLGGSWAFLRLREEMDRARRLGQPPWHGLRQLAEQVGIDELDDLGSILTLSQEEGASIVESLSAKAASMRQHLLADDLAHAHEQNRLLDLPLSLMGMTIVLFLVFPGLYTLTTT